VTPEMVGLITLAVTILLAMLHANARFAALETKVDLLYESFKQGVVQPYHLRGKNDGD
jgi:hypothetical protein